MSSGVRLLPDDGGVELSGGGIWVECSSSVIIFPLSLSLKSTPPSSDLVLFSTPFLLVLSSSRFLSKVLCWP
jgi:hypothetical protein